MDGDHPRVVPPGRPDWRFVCFPCADGKIIDTWHAAGLKGTGSHDVAVHGITVREELTCSPMSGQSYAPRLRRTETCRQLTSATSERSLGMKGDEPMPEFEVTYDVIRHVIMTTARHLGALNRDLTSAYSEAPDVAFSLAIAAAIATTLSSLPDSDQKANAVEAINRMLGQLQQPWRLAQLRPVLDGPRIGGRHRRTRHRPRDIPCPLGSKQFS